MTTTPATSPLQHVLRLIHCVQKERGASCALLGSRADSDDSARHAHTLRVASCRCSTNSAISSFYTSGSWHNHCLETDDKLEVAESLYQIRQLVDGGVGEAKKDLEHYHLILKEFNSFLASVIQVFVVETITKRRGIVKQALKTLSKSPEEAQLRKNYEIALSLMSLILSFVNLKESLGMERATLTGLMAFGAKVATNDQLPVIVNDLVMVVENHHRIMRELEKETGVNMESFWSESDTMITMSELAYDENYCSLLRLIAESIKPSDSMRHLQDHIRNNFDVYAFQQEMSMEAFWTGITLYMDRLHSTELVLLEELASDDNYGKMSYQDLDLLSLETTLTQETSLHAALKNVTLSSSAALSKRKAADVVNKLSSEELTRSMIAFLTQDSTTTKPQTSHEAKTKANVTDKASPSKVGMKDKPSLEDWEISLYEVEFQKRIGRGAAGTTYLGKWCGQKVAIKVAAINDMGLEGWANELKSLTKLHHCNIIHFLGAIYNPSPLTYCLVLEYCDGGDLGVVLNTSSTPPNFFETVSKGVASGLLYLHKKNIMHRDIKPGNVLLSGDLQGNFTAKLTDFGLAAMLQHNASVTSRGDLTAETGTYRYMAPEVIKHQKYQYPADIYSLSVLMWEIITREAPFKHMGQIEAAGSVAIEGKRPPFPKGIPSCVKSMIEKCWSESPEERMSTEEVIKALEELENNLTEEPKSWLNAPNGHPVYDEHKENAHHSQAVEQKKKPKKLNLFRRKS